MKTQTLLTTTFATTAIVGLLTFTNIANAGPNCGGKGDHGKHGQKYSQMSDADRTERMEKRLNRMATKLGLTDTQKTQLQALKQNSRNEIKPLRNEQRALRKEIRQLDPNAGGYAANLADAANRQAELTRQMIIAKGNKRQQMASILTPEQLAKKKEMRMNRKARFHKRKHMRHHKKHQQS
ncbi:MAG: Spy/CpxP family protein refolding chaperone [Cocleimonas sp.]